MKITITDADVPERFITADFIETPTDVKYIYLIAQLFDMIQDHIQEHHNLPETITDLFEY